MIVFSDFDGTFYPHDNEEIFAANLQVVQSFRKAGNKFCLATGRNLSSLERAWKIMLTIWTHLCLTMVRFVSTLKAIQLSNFQSHSRLCKKSPVMFWRILRMSPLLLIIVICRRDQTLHRMLPRHATGRSTMNLQTKLHYTLISITATE